MRIISIIFSLLASFVMCAGYALAQCPSPGCPVVAGNPVPASCSSEVCNTHVFFTDDAGRLLDLERNLEDHGWPCPGKCPVWDSSTRKYVRQYTDLGWKLNQISSDLSCTGISGAPAYWADNEYRMIAAVTGNGHLMVWTSPSSCCRHCAVDADSSCTCTLTPAADSCDPPVCSCECPGPAPCEPWPADNSSIAPSCGCDDAGPDATCCWQSLDLSALSGIEVKGTPAFGGRSIYIRTAKNHLIQYWMSGGSWNWTDLTVEVTGGIRISDDPSCFMDRNGIQFLVFRSDDDHLIGLVWNMAWYKYDLSELAGGITIEGRPAVFYNTDKASGHIFARGEDNQLYEWWWNSVDGLRFANVTALCNHQIDSNPSVCACNGGISVFFRDKDNHLIHISKTCQDPTAWRCEDLTKAGCGRLIAGDPACLALDGELSVFARTESGRLLRWVNGGSGWDVTDMLMDLGCPNEIGMYFVFIPAGNFEMGSPLGEYGRDDDEGPVHKVTITKPYYLQNTEVTQAQFQAVMGYNPSRANYCPTCPVDNVTWSEARNFIKAMNNRCEGKYEIPTEAEWEYAARAGTDTTWYFGSNLFELQDHAWYRDNSNNTSHYVANKKPNPWGLYDMYGNVAEWVADAYAPYPAADQVDPFALDNNWIHVVRGGNWTDPDTMLRSASRHYNLTPEASHAYVGIRLKRTSVGK